MMHLYRYRRASRAIDELEQQEIYFSKVDELNDPMEGFKDLFWSGDEIAWRALSKHYVLTLLQTTYLAFTAFIAGAKFDPKQIESVLFNAPGCLPETPIRGIFQQLATQFLADPAVAEFLAAVTSRPEPIRRNELLGYLRALHPLAAIPLFTDLQNRGLWPGFVPPPDNALATTRQNAINVIQAASMFLQNKMLNSKRSDALFAAMETTMEETMLIAQANMKDRDKKGFLIFIMSDFPRAYVKALDRLVHGDCYVACFTGRPDNHSMWSTYGDGHRGVCFMFKPTESETDGPVLHLNRVVGATGSAGRPITFNRGFAPHPVRPVRYSREYPAIDFFRSLGRIRQTDMDNFWYRGDDGQFSVCRNSVYADEESWRRSYWERFVESALYKTPEWEHEEEHRAIAHSIFDLSAAEDRKFGFRFGDLAGVVFGARTSAETKLKIMEIVSRKCASEGRDDFKFFEVGYSSAAFRMRELTLLKVEPNDEVNSSPDKTAAA